MHWKGYAMIINVVQEWFIGQYVLWAFGDKAYPISSYFAMKYKGITFIDDWSFTIQGFFLVEGDTKLIKTQVFLTL